MWDLRHNRSESSFIDLYSEWGKDLTLDQYFKFWWLKPCSILGHNSKLQKVIGSLLLFSWWTRALRLGDGHNHYTFGILWFSLGGSGYPLTFHDLNWLIIFNRRQRRIRSLDGICNRAFDWCWSDVLDLSWFFVSRQMGPFLEVVEWNTCCQTASCFMWVDSLPFLVQMFQQSEMHPKLNFEVIFMLLYLYVA